MIRRLGFFSPTHFSPPPTAFNSRIQLPFFPTFCLPVVILGTVTPQLISPASPGWYFTKPQVSSMTLFPVVIYGSSFPAVRGVGHLLLIFCGCYLPPNLRDGVPTTRSLLTLICPFLVTSCRLSGFVVSPSTSPYLILFSPRRRGCVLLRTWSLV